MVIGDMGSVRPGAPTLTIALRGMATVIVEVRTLAGPKHSGQFGGAAPDALITLLHALSALHDEHGDVAVAGLRREEWTGRLVQRRGVPRAGRDRCRGCRSWAPAASARASGPGPALTVTGIDAQPVDQALNAVVPYARAKLSLRIHPEQDPEEAQAILVRHLEGLRPFGIPLKVTATETGTGFAAKTTGPAYEAARAALETAWGSAAARRRDRRLDPARERTPGSGARRLRSCCMGTTDGFANIHAPNERVLIDEFEKAVVAEAEFFGRFAELWARIGERAS